MRILAVDPSLKALGLALLEGERVVVAWSLPLIGTLARRLDWVHVNIRFLVGDRERPDIVVIESPGPWPRGSAKSKQDTIEKLAMVRGCVMAGATSQGVKCEEMTVGEARTLICGRNNAPKGEAYKVLELEGYDLPRRPDRRRQGSRGGASEDVVVMEQGPVDQDAADAIVIGLAWARRAKFNERGDS